MNRILSMQNINSRQNMSADQFYDRENQMALVKQQKWASLVNKVKCCTVKGFWIHIAVTTFTILFMTLSPVHAVTITQTDDFENFSCSAPWQAHGALPNNIEYKQCSNGWFTQKIITHGCIGDVAPDLLGKPSKGVQVTKQSNLACILDDVHFYKTYQVKKGQPIDSISFDIAAPGINVSRNFSVSIYDGRVTDLAGSQLPSLLHQETTATGTTSSIENIFVPYSVTGITPTSNNITLLIQTYQPSSVSGTGFTIDNVEIVQTQTTPTLANGDFALAWDNYYPDFAVNNSSEGVDSKLDSLGNLYMTNRSNIDFNGFDIHTVKYDASGNLLWNVNYDGGFADEPVAMALDGAGNSYIAAKTSSTGTDHDMLIIKYDNAGTQVWTQTYNAAGSHDVPVDIQLDSLGNVIVLGTSNNGTNDDLVTIKFDSAGVQQWQKIYNNGSKDQAVGVALDSEDNVYITARSRNGSSDDIVTIRYSAGTGNQDWLTRYDAPSHIAPSAVSVHGNGTSGLVYVAGDEFGQSYSHNTLAYDAATGVQQWIQEVPSTAFSKAVAIEALTDGVLVTTTSGDFNTGDIVTTKYDLNGTVLWTMTYDNAGSNDAASALATDGNGNVYVTGTSDGDIVTIIYDLAGNETQVLSYDNSNTDVVSSIEIGTDQHSQPTIHLVGRSFTGVVNDAIVLKYLKMQPDLVADSVSGPSSAFNNQVIQVNSSISNLLDTVNGAGADAGAFDIGLYLAPTTVVPDVTINDTFTGFVCAANPWVATYPFSSYRGAADPTYTTNCGNNTHVTLSPYEPATSITGTTGTGHIIDNLDGTAHVQFASMANTGFMYLLRQYDIGNPTSFDIAGQYRVRGIGQTPGGHVQVRGYFIVYDGAVTNPEGESPSILASTSYVGDGALWGAFQNASFANLTPSSNIITVAVKLLDAVKFGNVPELELDNVVITARQHNSVVADENQWHQIGSRTVSSLASGAQDTASSSAMLPSSGVLTAGDYALVAKADVGDAVTETDENNNVSSNVAPNTLPTLISVNDAPELVPSSFTTGTSTVNGGEAFTVDFTVDNTHAPAAGSFSMQFIASTDTIVGNGDDINIGSHSIASLAGNSSNSSSASVAVPASATAGNYYLGVIVDDANAVIEVDELNNTLMTVATIAVIQAPDVELLSVSGPLAGIAGTAITISNSVQTTLEDVNTAFDVGFYLSTDSVIEASDALVGSRTIASLLIGQTDTDNTVITLPAGLTNGVYYLGAIADSGNVIFETNEANNAKADDSATTISIISSAADPTPDLMMSNVSGAPTHVVQGSSFTINNTVENILPGSASAFDVGIYLSTDSVITPTDTLIGTRALTGLSGNSSDNAAATVTIPIDMLPQVEITAVLTEDFTGFSCPGPDTPTIPDSSLTRACSNGVTLYSQDIYAAYDQGVPTASGSNLASIQSNSAGLGNNWLLRTFDVTGANTVDVSATMRIGLSFGKFNTVGRMQVFDGAYTNVDGLTPLDTFSTTCNVTGFCTWQNPSFTGLLPTSGSITVGFSVNDGNAGRSMWLEVDDLTVSTHSTPDSYDFYIGAIADSPAAMTLSGLGTTPNTVGLWKLEENAQDSSANGNDGVLNNGPVFVAGQYGQAISLDGVDDSVNLGSGAGLNIAGDITVEAWVNPTVGANQGAILHKGNHYSLFWRANGALSWADSSVWSFASFGNHGNVPAGQWSHVMVTKSGSTVTIYINGVVAVSKAFGGPITTDSSIPHIGCYAGNSGGTACSSSYFNGLIDDVAIYNAALTATDAQNHTAGNFAGMTPVTDLNANGQVTELNENNNSAVMGNAITVLASPMADLTVSNVTGPAAAARGDTISVTTIVDNISPFDAGAFDVGIYLSTDATIDVGDTLVGTRTINTLLANSVDSAATNVTIPSNLFVTGSGFQQPITITNNGASLTDYPVELTLDTAGLIAAGKMRTDGGDIRFYADAALSVPVNYFVKSGINTSTTKIWIKVPTIANPSTTIYMTYGDLVLTSLSNGSAVFDHYDGFDTDNWTDIGTMSFVDTANSRLHIHTDRNTSNDTSYFTLPQPLTGDFELQFRYFPVSEAANAYYTIQLSDTTNLDSANNNELGLNFYGGNSARCSNQATYFFNKTIASVVTSTSVWCGQNASLGQWYTVKIKRLGNTATVQLWNSAETVAHLNTTLDVTGIATLNNLYVGGINSGHNNMDGIAYVDDILLKPAVSVEPVPTFGAEVPFTTGPQTYYIGAIADIAGQVTELDENNNAGVMGGVTPTSTVVSVTSRTASVASTGGGSFSWIELILGMLGLTIVHSRLQRRFDKHDHWLR
ncbi:MAG: DUF2341 domain-containing protein [Gammaproteobacteria bacterium]